MTGINFYAADASLAEEMPGKKKDAQARNVTSMSLNLDRTKVLDLFTAQRIALAENPSLAATQDRINQASERVTQALSDWWPQLDIRGAGRRDWLSERGKDEQESLASIARIINPTTDIKFEDPQSTFEANLRARWILFNGFKREFSIRSARFGEQENQEARNDARRLLLEAVAQSYYDAQLARENIAIEEADALFNQRQADTAKARLRAGTGSQSDVLNFEVQVNTAKTRLIQAKRDYETALIGLAALMGIPDASIPSHIELTRLKRETDTELILPDANSLNEYAQKNRPDVLQSNYLVEQAEAQVKVAQADYWPEINLSGSLDGERNSNLKFTDDDFGYTIGAELRYNLFDGGNRKARFREAKFRLNEAQNDLRDVLNTVSSEVREALADLKATQQQIVLQRSNLALSQQNRDLVAKEYKAGQASLVRLNEAQRDLTTARARLARALVSLRDAWQNLDAATGQILAPFNDQGTSKKLSYVADEFSQTP
jgi:outer membrane protein TolC